MGNCLGKKYCEDDTQLVHTHSLEEQNISEDTDDYEIDKYESGKYEYSKTFLYSLGKKKDPIDNFINEVDSNQNCIL